MADKGIEVGDKVQWNYGAGHPQGTVEEIKSQTGEKVQIESQKGNTVTRNADPDNPAAKVHAERKNVDVVKRMSELEKVGGEDAKEGAGEGAGGEKAKAGEGGKEPGVGEKRVRESAENTEEKEGEVEAQEGETADAPAAAGGEGRKEKDQEPETKKVKLGEEAGGKEMEGAAPAADQAGEATTKGRGRGKGRGRAKTASTATTGTRRTSTRTKKGVAAAGEGGEKAESGAGGPEVVMAEASVPGEVEGEVEQGANVTAEQAPAGHTRSKDV